MACAHEHTHPSHCDDCGGLWCYVCRTYHTPTSPAKCMDELHATIAKLRAEVEGLRKEAHDMASETLSMFYQLAANEQLTLGVLSKAVVRAFLDHVRNVLAATDAKGVDGE